MKEKGNEKKGAETAAKDTAPGAVEGTAPEGGSPDKKTAGETEATVRVRFVNTYTGVKGNFYAGREYDLTPELYEVFRNDCEKRG